MVKILRGQAVRCLYALRNVAYYFGLGGLAYWAVSTFLRPLYKPDPWLLYRGAFLGGEISNFGFIIYQNASDIQKAPDTQDQYSLYVFSHAGINGLTALRRLNEIQKKDDAPKPGELLKTFGELTESPPPVVYLVDQEEYEERHRRFYEEITLEFGISTTINSLYNDITLLLKTYRSSGDQIEGTNEAYLGLARLVDLANLTRRRDQTKEERYRELPAELESYKSLMAREVGVLISDLSRVKDLMDAIFIPSFVPGSMYPSIGISSFENKVAITIRYPRESSYNPYYPYYAWLINRIINNIFPSAVRIE